MKLIENWASALSSSTATCIVSLEPQLNNNQLVSPFLNVVDNREQFLFRDWLVVLCSRVGFFMAREWMKILACPYKVA